MKHFALIIPLLSASPAMAHHPLEGMPMRTFEDGILSGLGHPVLGADHLFFVLAVGIASALIGRVRSAPLAYIAAMLTGVLLSAAGLNLPMREAVIAASLVVLGLLVTRGAPGQVLLPVLVGFGLFHGAAFGAALAGYETAAPPAVLVGYLAGLGAIQYAIALGTGWLALRGSVQGGRMAGAMVAGAGALLIFDRIEPHLVAALIG